MSAPAVALNPLQIAPNRQLQTKWLYVVSCLLFVCCTSTTIFSGYHTGLLLNTVWRTILGSWHYDLRGEVNEILRKVGHFFGYGMIGIIFRNAWYSTVRVVRNWLMPVSATLAVASTFAIACLDEWHQRYVPQRVGSIRDAGIDAAGALFLNVVVWWLRARRRRNALRRLQSARHSVTL